MARSWNPLRDGEARVAEVAARVRDGWIGAFSAAFARHVGRPPMRDAREQAAAARSRG